jgi:DNA-binding MarR family transcriptional regulator/GNAT superfamily N-acetyltransferase
LISDIRAASRDLVREFGLMNKTVAGTDLSVSAVHAIIEIGAADGLPSRDLCEKLLLEKSTISRLVKSLVDGKQVREVRSKNDARMKYLHLTSGGMKTLGAIDNFARAQVSGALDRLDDRAKQRVLKGLQEYAAALKAADKSRVSSRSPDMFAIRTGYAPAIIGRIVEMLQSHMSGHYSFGAAFETRITTDLAGFIARIEAPQNEIWRAERDGRIVGSISIDGQNLGDGLAHLRWFIVSEEMRGAGAGSALLARALDFCDALGFRETHLWTVQGLDAARKLYEKQGFALTDEYYGDQWGANVLEQKFVRPYRR